MERFRTRFLDKLDQFYKILVLIWLGDMYMGIGYLKIQTVTAGGEHSVANASVIITDGNGKFLYQFSTDQNGNAPKLQLETPDKWHNENPSDPGPHYAKYDALVSINGYRPVVYQNIMIFDTSTTIQMIDLEPLIQGESPRGIEYVNVGGHVLD